MARKARVEISIAGKNVSEDLAPYLLGMTFNDKTSNEVDDITITIDDRDELFCDNWMPMTGDKLEVKIVCTDWEIEDGELIDTELFCGIFEVDLVTESGPPSVVEIKAVSSIGSDIRRVLRNFKWQKTNLKKIGSEIAKKYKLEYEFIAENEQDEEDGVPIAEVMQNDQSDLAFLSKLAEDNDYVIKLDPEKLTLCSQVHLEFQDAVLEFSKYDLSSRSAGRQGYDLYKEAKASYFCKKTKKMVSAKSAALAAKRKAKDAQNRLIIKHNKEYAKAHNITVGGKGRKGKKQPDRTPTKPTSVYSTNAGTKTLIIRQKFKTEEEARNKAEAALKQKNRGEWKISGEVMGEVMLLAGSNIYINDYGQFDGFYFVETTTHTVTSNGYRTSFVAHKCEQLEVAT